MENKLENQISKKADVVASTVAQQKKAPKVKRKRYQSIGHEWIKLITMMMHKQKEVMGLQVHPETQKKEKVDLTNTQRINLLQNYNYQINREQLEKLKNTEHLQQVADQRIVLEMKKKYRTIEQEALICSYQSTDQYQFDYKIFK